MNYTKPEVAVLGQAVSVIEHRLQKGLNFIDGAVGQPPTAVAPAYDLDE
jgi:hypothetical protein